MSSVSNSRAKIRAKFDLTKWVLTICLWAILLSNASAQPSVVTDNQSSETCLGTVIASLRYNYHTTSGTVGTGVLDVSMKVGGYQHGARLTDYIDISSIAGFISFVSVDGWTANINPSDVTVTSINAGANVVVTLGNGAGSSRPYLSPWRAPFRDKNVRNPKNNPNDCQGMPEWSISEPDISLWLNDEPLGYQPAMGPRVSFQVSYKQREAMVGQEGNVFSVGNSWNCSWFSYISQSQPDVYNNDDTGDPIQPVVNTVLLSGGGQVDIITNFANEIGWGNVPSGTRLEGDTATGFVLTHSDGSQEIYGFIVTNSAGVFQRAFMTQRKNRQGQGIKFNYASYDPNNPTMLLHNVVDADGRTNFIYYGNNDNHITKVVDPFGRATLLTYDNYGNLTNIIDTAGNSSSVAYDANGSATQLTTPYGTTTFAINDWFDTNEFFLQDNTSLMQVGASRSILITKPDNSHELYYYAASTFLPDLFDNAPNFAPYGDVASGQSVLGAAYYNSFHWGARQYENLSTTNIEAFNESDFRKGHVKHWLQCQDYQGQIFMGGTVAMEREPSPDAAGMIEGKKTWYGYDDTPVLFALFLPYGIPAYPTRSAFVLPSGNSYVSHTDYNLFGNVTTNVVTYSWKQNLTTQNEDGTYLINPAAPNVYGLQTNVFVFATNEIDLVAAYDARGVLMTSNVYNGWHQILTNYNALDELTIFTYNANQQVSTVISSSGVLATNVYNGDHSLAQLIVPGFTTNRFTYANDLVETTTDSRGVTIANTWDALNRLTGVTFPDGSYSSNVFTILDQTATRDRMGNWTYYGYDNMRRNTSVTNALGQVATFNYCSCGALQSTLDPAGNLTQFFYDNQGRLTNTIAVDGFATYQRYNVLGQVVSAGDSAGHQVTYVYNDAGGQAASLNAQGPLFANSFDILGRVTNSVNGNGVGVNTMYDLVGRPLSRSYSDGGVEHFGYSPNVTGATSYTNQIGSVTLFAYDPLGRKTNEISVGVSTNAYDYSGAGNLLAMIDGLNHVTTWNYDQYGRMTSKVDGNGMTNFVYHYDANNRLTNRWTPAKGTTTYVYDALGNKQAVLYGQSSITYAYDELNRMTNMVDGLGTNQFVYDNVGEMLSAGGIWPNDTVSYSYNQRMRNAVSMAGWTNQYAYDGLMRMTNVTSPAGAFGYSYLPGKQMELARLLLPNTSYVTNGYDVMGRLSLTALETSANHTLDGYAYGYDQLGQRISIVRNIGLNATTVNLEYDRVGELTSWSGQEANGTRRLNEQLGYAYDAAGNLAGRTNNTLTQSFVVDGANQLTGIARTGTLTVSGNTPLPASQVTVNGQSAQTYSDFTFAGSNGVPLVDGVNYFTNIAQNYYGTASATNTLAVTLPVAVNLQYDANGNLTNDGLKCYSYDEENQLTNVLVAGQWREDFRYDGMGRRRITRRYGWNGSWTLTNEVRYVYSGSAVLQEWDSNNVAQVSYTRGMNGLLARTDSGGSIYYHTDGNGNVTALQDGSQYIVGRYLYDPFGRTLGEWGSLAEVNQYRFASKEYDGLTGLSYFIHRYYSPNLQRFINRDPIGEQGGRNLYGYCGNDPICLMDVMGFCPRGFWGTFFDGAGNDLEGIYYRANQLALIGSDIIGYAAAAAAGAGGDYDGNSDLFHSIYNNSSAYNADQMRQNILNGTADAESNIMTFGLYGIITGTVQAANTGDYTALQDNFAWMLLGAGKANMDDVGPTPSGIRASDVESQDGRVEQEQQQQQQGPKQSAAEGGAYSAIGSTGQVGEQWLSQNLGGESQVYFNTTQGGRYVDQLVGDVANESKVGYQSLTPSIQLQISKDAELLNGGTFQSVNWHFFQSPVTGLGGPSQPLLNALQQNGINVIIHQYVLHHYTTTIHT